jgi:hypothetical protein
LQVKVADTNTAAETLFHESFHLGPQDVERNCVFDHSIVRPVDKVKVNIVCLQFLKTKSEGILR